MPSGDRARSEASRDMIPVAFDGCAGWLHRPPGASGGDVAVVLCPGLRNDGWNAYRSFRLLAGALAEAGYPTLRFDYPGTGDSVELAGPEAEHWSAWRRSVERAAAHLREWTGATQIVLGGLRFGALLAATAAGPVGAAGLILLAPVTRGNSYMRQLAVEAKLHEAAAAADGGLTLHEMHLSPATVAAIGKLDLRKIVLPAGCKVAIYAQTPGPVLGQCIEIWSGAGAEVASHDLTGLDAFLRPVFLNHEPPAENRRVTGWLRAALPARPLPLGAPVVAETLRGTHYMETPLRFGPDEALFGVLCRPLAEAHRQVTDRAGELAVVIANSGADPHSIPRGVDLARRLAASGIASLRIDFAGIADSVALGDVGTHIYEVDRRPDFAAAIDALAALGFRRFAFQGLCAGAYHAWLAGLDDPRVGFLLLVNLPFFAWRPGTPLELLNDYVFGKNPLLVLRRVGTREFLTQLREGRFHLRSRFPTYARWFLEQAKIAAGQVAMRLGWRSRAERAARELAARTRTLFLFSEGDEGIGKLAQSFGPGRAPPGAKLTILAGTDHGFSGPHMLGLAAAEMLRFLSEAAPGEDAAEPSPCVAAEAAPALTQAPCATAAIS